MPTRTLLRSLRKSALRPQHYNELGNKRIPSERIGGNKRILSAKSHSLYFKFVVVLFQVTVPIDGSAEIRVAAPGYKPWGMPPHGSGADQIR
jgi:hypothetical protein